MKYKIILNLLTCLVYIKRFIWWVGRGMRKRITKSFGQIWHFFGYFFYKADFIFEKKLRLKTGLNRKIFKRDVLQVLILLFLFFLAIPQTKLYSSTQDSLPGRNTIAYSLITHKEEFGELEEVSADLSSYNISSSAQWKEGTISKDDLIAIDYLQHNQELASTLVAGGTAISKPFLSPGAVIESNSESLDRSKNIKHIVQAGETVSGIALRYGVSVATILWANDLSSWSLLQLGDALIIPPTNGLYHTVASGDTLIAIANRYGGTNDEIVNFNNLSSDGSDLKIGQKIFIPDGVKQYQAVTQVAKTTPVYSVPSTPSNIPASSNNQPSSSGFVWPSALRVITQYFTWAHYGLDISGPRSVSTGSAIYAAKSGRVKVAAYGWNRGYGNYIIIDHGNGYETLYGHNQTLLVNVGDYVTTGQTISLMGNTGRSTGPHVHFEIRVNGRHVNPLSYIR